MRKDIALEQDTNDIRLEGGDFKIESSDLQHVEHIVHNQKGEYKEFPLLGFGAENYLKTNTEGVAFKRDLKVQLEYDGYKNPDIDISEGIWNLVISI